MIHNDDNAIADMCPYTIGKASSSLDHLSVAENRTDNLLRHRLSRWSEGCYSFYVSGMSSWACFQTCQREPSQGLLILSEFKLSLDYVIMSLLGMRTAFSLGRLNIARQNYDSTISDSKFKQRMELHETTPANLAYNSMRESEFY